MFLNTCNVIINFLIFNSKAENRFYSLQPLGRLLVLPQSSARHLTYLDNLDDRTSGFSIQGNSVETSPNEGWTTWPECLCGAPEGVDCVQTTQPKSDGNTRYGEGGTCSWRAWSESSYKVISTSLYGPQTRYVNSTIYKLFLHLHP